MTSRLGKSGDVQCLDRPHRLAYVLGEIMELPGPEAAEVLEISPALFRKRLQHAREGVLTFTKSHCGLVSDAAPCQCNRRVSRDAIAGTVEAHPLQFGRRATSFTEARAMVRRVEEARWAMEIHRSSQPQASSIDFAQRLLQAIDPPRGPGSLSVIERLERNSAPRFTLGIWPSSKDSEHLWTAWLPGRPCLERAMKSRIAVIGKGTVGDPRPRAGACRL